MLFLISRGDKYSVKQILYNLNILKDNSKKLRNLYNESLNNDVPYGLGLYKVHSFS